MPHPLLPSSTWTTPVNPPPISTHSKIVQTLIRRLNTPQKVQSWLKTLKYNKAETMRTLESVAHYQSAHCLEGVLSAAAILEYHGPAQHLSGANGAGYPPLILDLESPDLLNHTLLLYRHRGRYGSIGMSRDVGLYGRKPVYRNLHTLVQSYAAPYVDARAEITGYGVLDLRTLKKTDWRNSKRSVWYVEQALDRLPHRPFRSSPNFIRTWRKRYLAFRKAHPDRQPDIYPHQEHWM